MYLENIFKILSSKWASLNNLHFSIAWNFEEKIIVWDGLVTSLKSDIGLDQEQLVNMSIKSPEIPGRYILDIDLVQNSAFWFGAIGSQIARIMIDVV